MPQPRLLLLALALPALLGATPPSGGLTLGDLTKLFRQRYAERAPGRADLEAAELKAALGGGFRFDPRLDAAAERRPGADDQSVTGTLSQGTPFGTEVALTQSRRRAEAVSPATGAGETLETKTTGVRVSQELLRGGPWHGLSAGDARDAGLALDLLTAQVAFDEALLKAVEAFAAAQEAAASAASAAVTETGAQRQHDAVRELVAAGYKPKADLLISEAALLRASLASEQARQRAEASLRDLALALYQRPEDPPLAVSQQGVSDEELEGLTAVAWPSEPPSVAQARLRAERAEADADVASRDDLPRLAVSVANERVASGGDGTSQRTVGLSLSVPLVGAIRRDKAALARLSASTARSDAAQARQAAELERTSLEKSLATARLAHEVAERLRGLSERTVEIEAQKYADGKSSISEVRRVQEDLDRAALAVISARKDVILARLRWAKAAGSLSKVLP